LSQESAYIHPNYWIITFQLELELTALRMED
jgi:hypothetical protein